MSNMYYDGTIYIDNEDMYLEVDVHAEASGFYTPGDSWGYGCEPPDGDFEIDEVEYISVRTCDEDGNYSNVALTDEIKQMVMDQLYKEDFEVHEYEPDYDDYYEL